MFQRAIVFLFSAVLFPVSIYAVDINGQVRIGARSGLPNPATVQLVRERQVVLEQFTGLDGRFEFPSVEPGRYVIRAKYEDMPETEVVVEALRGNYRVPITIQPPKDSPVGSTETVSINQLQIPRAAKREYAQGLKRRKAGDCAQALPHLQKAIALAPTYGEAYNELGICLKKQGELKEAERAFLKAVRYNGTIYPSINLADVYAIQHRYEEGRQLLQAAIQKNPVEGDLFFALARIYFDEGNTSKAEAAGLEAHSRTHRTADVHLLLAKIYLSSKNYPALTTQLETYLVENPAGSYADEVRKSLKELPPDQ